MANKIVQSVSKPYLFGDDEIHIGCSVGIAIFPDSGEDFESLMKAADKAMYEAKKNNDSDVALVTQREQ